MTVAEFIELLSGFPPGMPVAVRTVRADSGESDIENPSLPHIEELDEVDIGTNAKPFHVLIDRGDNRYRRNVIRSRVGVSVVLVWDGRVYIPPGGESALPEAPHIMGDIA
jgi:hypothetical protein